MDDHRWVSQVFRLTFAAGLVLLVSSRSSSTVVDDAQTEQQRIQGRWRIAHCEYAGGDVAQLVGVEDTIDGAFWLRPKRRTDVYQLKLDPAKNPKWVDLSAERLGNQVLKGIYLLNGDKLTICYAYDPDLPRPTEFKTMSGVRAYVYVLERVK
jgi:uncharacterized protein (TIGR03067 family)